MSKSIENSTFSGCKSLTNISIPADVTSIENYAFSGCTSLTNITIPPNVRLIGDVAFTSCTSLINIILPESITLIQPHAFFLCSPRIIINTDKKTVFELIKNLIPQDVHTQVLDYSMTQSILNTQKHMIGYFLYQNPQLCPLSRYKLLSSSDNKQDSTTLDSIVLGHILEMSEDINTTLLALCSRAPIPHDLNETAAYNQNLQSILLSYYLSTIYLKEMEKEIPSDYLNKTKIPTKQENRDILEAYDLIKRLVKHLEKGKPTNEFQRSPREDDLIKKRDTLKLHIDPFKYSENSNHFFADNGNQNPPSAPEESKVAVLSGIAL